MRRYLDRWPVRNEEGAFLVLYAVLILGLLMMVAIVIDLGALRADRRVDRSAADSAATAGAFDLQTSSAAACQTAWEYALENLRIDPASATSPCGGFPQCVAATATASVPVTGTAGGYTITITNPVVDTDPLLNAEAIGGDVTQPVSSTSDGAPCSRVGVIIKYTRDSFFAKVAGFNQNSTSVHSVGLRITEDNGIPLSLVVLDPTRCGVLTSSGSGGIEITGTANPNLVGGVLAVSDATSSCSGSTPLVLDAGGTSHISVTQPGHIFVAAMNGSTCTSPACDPGQIDTTTPLGDRGVYPGPEDPILVPDRGLVDGRYNCRANYNGTGSDPNYRTVHRRGTSGAILPACSSTMVSNPESDFVNHLYREVLAGALEPVAPTIYTNCSTLPSPLPGPARIDCAMPNNFTLTGSGDVWFNNTSTLNPTSLTINGNAVFSGGLDLSNGRSAVVRGNAEFRSGALSVSGPTVGGGSLTVQGAASGVLCTLTEFVTTATDCVRRSSPTGAFVFLRSGVTSFSLNGGNVNLPAATVFGEGGSTATSTAGPIIDVGGGGSVTWKAPTTGPFRNLLSWSDKVSDLTSGATWHKLAGGGGLTLEGIFFSPLAKVRMTGGSTVTPLKAQFWAGALQQDGSGVFSMTPDGTFILVPVGAGTRLIR